jgi:hypothetical protein
MARAAGKRSKKRGRRRPAPRLRLVNRLRWEEEGRFTDPISYIICAYDRRAEQLSSVGELPELAGLVIKAIMYFEIAAATIKGDIEDFLCEPAALGRKPSQPSPGGHDGDALSGSHEGRQAA